MSDGRKRLERRLEERKRAPRSRPNPKSWRKKRSDSWKKREER